MERKVQKADSIFSKMKNVATRVFSTSYKLDLASQNWQYSLGQFCQICQVRLKSEDCISICNCNLYCHEQCFIRQISPYLSIKSKVTCINCKKQINFEMNYTIDWVCNRRPVYIISIIGSVLIMVAIYLLIAQGAYRSFLSDTVSYTFLGLLGLFLVYAILRSSRRKMARIQDIKVTNTNLLKKGQTQKMLFNTDLGSSKGQIISQTLKKLSGSNVEMSGLDQIM